MKRTTTKTNRPCRIYRLVIRKKPHWWSFASYVCVYEVRIDRVVILRTYSCGKAINTAAAIDTLITNITNDYED